MDFNSLCFIDLILNRSKCSGIGNWYHCVSIFLMFCQKNPNIRRFLQISCLIFWFLVIFWNVPQTTLSKSQCFVSFQDLLYIDFLSKFFVVFLPNYRIFIELGRIILEILSNGCPNFVKLLSIWSCIIQFLFILCRIIDPAEANLTCPNPS